VWRRQQTTRAGEPTAEAEVVEVSSTFSIVVPGPQARVWELIHDPILAVGVSDHVVNAWREAGSPVGLGEIQVFELATPAGALRSRSRVTECEWGSRAVLELVQSRPGRVRAGSDVELRTLEDGTVEVAMRAWYLLSGPFPADEVEQLRRSMDEESERLKVRLPAYLESRRAAEA